MNVFLKVDSLGNSIGDNLSLSGNLGSVLPNTIAKNQLLSGVNISIADSSTGINIFLNGECDKSIWVPIAPCI
jgi:hypothetical protein